MQEVCCSGMAANYSQIARVAKMSIFDVRIDAERKEGEYIGIYFSIEGPDKIT